MIIPMLCVTIFVILVVWFLLPRVARLMIHTPTAISIFVCLSMVQLMAVFISLHGGLTYDTAFSPGAAISYNTAYRFTSQIRPNGDMTLRVSGSDIGTASTGCTASLSGMNSILIGGVDGWSDLIGPIYEVIM